MNKPALERRLRRSDVILLCLFCALLFGYLLVDRRVLTPHETVHCQNVREMLADGDWLIPHYGGRPWLERPPLPHWITAAVVSLCGPEQEWGYRLSSALVGLAIVLLVASTAALWYGRTIGVLSGAILATMHEFKQYANGPEADIHLCLLTTAVVALFVRLEFGRLRGHKRLACEPQPGRPTSEPLVATGCEGEDTRFLGRRPWLVLGFFLLLGLTNLAKGLFFGTVFAGLPVAAYLLANRDWRALRRYIWLWGWLVFVAAASAWAILAWRRYPDIVELWKSDYVGRVKEGYMREPFWYYFANLPFVLLPWSPVALVGLGLTARGIRKAASPERFLWCWAVLPVLFFSIPSGKHHHYLLQCIAPWSVLSALGSLRVWQWAVHATAQQRRPGFALVLLVFALEAILMEVGRLFPGPAWIQVALMAGFPVMISLTWWAVTCPNGQLATAALFGVLLVVHSLVSSYRTHCLDRYGDDEAFIQDVRDLQGKDDSPPLCVLADLHPLNASWLLFYLGDEARLLHNVSFLRDDHILSRELLIVGHAYEEQELRRYGTPRVVFQSRHSRAETAPADRWTLFRLHFHDSLARVPGDVYISPMQATGREMGPYLP